MLDFEAGTSLYEEHIPPTNDFHYVTVFTTYAHIIPAMIVKIDTSEVV